MILLVAIGLIILAVLVGAGNKDQALWQKEGYSSWKEWDNAKKGGRRECTFDERSYYFQKAYNEWRDRKWTTEEEEKFLQGRDCLSSWIRDISNKMAYDDGLCPFNCDMREFDPNNIHKAFWKAFGFAFTKWKEEGINIPC